MYKTIIKEMLLARESKTYTLILEMYCKEMSDLKSMKVFRLWLAKELEVDVALINLQSLFSAKKRMLDKQSKQKKPEGLEYNPSQPAFKFSTGDKQNPSLIKEL